jgi:hypothetical protein
MSRTSRGLRRRSSPWFSLGTDVRCEQPLAQRPIERVVEDVRRLGARYRHPPPGIAFVKLEGIRRAYDQALANACACLGIEHLLLVLPPGTELDHERNRVENSLWLAGLGIDGS